MPIALTAMTSHCCASTDLHAFPYGLDRAYGNVIALLRLLSSWRVTSTAMSSHCCTDMGFHAFSYGLDRAYGNVFALLR